MHRDISINTLSLPPGPLPEQVDAVARLGARGLSPDLDQVNEAGIAASARAIRDAGLEVATLTHRAFAFDTSQAVRDARERLMASIETAAAIGAQSITMTTGGRGELAWAEARDAFAQAIHPCLAPARAAGIRLGIEPTSHLYADVSIAHRLSDTAEIARAAGIAVMIDLFACWFDSDIEAAVADAAAICPLVQVSDYVYGDRGLPCRAVPGDGAVPWQVLVRALVGAGFTGWFDLEIIGPRLRHEGHEAGLARAGRFIGDLLTAAGRSAD